MIPGPQEHIAEMQRRQPFPSSELTSLYASMQSEWTRRLMPRVPKILGKCFDTGYFALGIIFDLTPNAYNEPVDRRGWAITFNVGLIELIYSTARALSTRVRLTARTSDNPTFEKTVRLLQEIFRGFRETQTVVSTEFPLERHQIEWAARLALEAELFLVAHELGHVVRRHFDLVLPRLRARADADTAEILDNLALQDHCEYDADEIGFLLALGVLGLDGIGDELATSERYRGAEFALQIFRALESAGVRFEDTHPPAGDRLAKVRSWFHAYCENGRQRYVNNLGFLVLLVFERVLAEVGVVVDPMPLRQLDSWASPGLAFAERVGRGAYWIDALFSDAGLLR